MKYKKGELIFNLVFCAIMASFSIVLDKYLSFPKGNFFLKFTLYGLPLMFVGIMLGTKYGLFSGLITGIVLQLTSEWGITITAPIWALAPIGWGLISGIISDAFKKNLNIMKVAMIVLCSSIMAFILNTLAMFSDILLIRDSYYTVSAIITDIPSRLVSMIILWFIYIPTLYMLYKALKKQMIDKNND